MTRFCIWFAVVQKFAQRNVSLVWYENTRFPDRSGAAESWLAQVRFDNVRVDGDRKVSKEATFQHGKVHARGNAMLDFSSS